MTFADSIRTCLARYADFSGRASRPEFWWWMLFVLVGTLVLGLVSDLAGNIFSLALLVPSLAVGARRLHDIDRSGWWQLVCLVPVAGLLLMIYWAVQPAVEPNRYGSAGRREAQAGA